MDDPALLRDALQAVTEAVCIPFAATAGDEQVRAKILIERLMHLRTFLNRLPDDSLDWGIAYLRERLAEHPAEGYRTWHEAVAEMHEKENPR